MGPRSLFLWFMKCYLTFHEGCRRRRCHHVVATSILYYLCFILCALKKLRFYDENISLTL
mgnify:CR=1 FL=1